MLREPPQRRRRRRHPPALSLPLILLATLTHATATVTTSASATADANDDDAGVTREEGAPYPPPPPPSLVERLTTHQRVMEARRIRFEKRRAASIPTSESKMSHKALLERLGRERGEPRGGAAAPARRREEVALMHRTFFGIHQMRGTSRGRRSRSGDDGVLISVSERGERRHHRERKKRSRSRGGHHHFSEPACNSAIKKSDGGGGGVTCQKLVLVV